MRILITCICMQTYDNRTFFPSEYSRNLSTLLIPDFLYSRFLEKVTHFGGSHNYLNYLLKHGFNTLIEFHPDLRIRIEYQAKGQNLQKYNFTPFDEDWLYLKSLAFVQGISMAYLFVLLLIEDLERGLDCSEIIEYKNRVPTNNREIKFTHHVTITEFTHFHRKVRLRL